MSENSHIPNARVPSAADEAARQSVSALMDGALSMEESRFLLRRMGHESELIAVWSRYHLLRECLQGRPAITVSNAFAERVQLALPLQPPQQNRGAGRWLRFGAGGAIAASVAAAALMLMRPPTNLPIEPVADAQPQVQQSTRIAAAAASPQPVPVAEDTPPLLLNPASPWLYVQPAAATRDPLAPYPFGSIEQQPQLRWLHGDPAWIAAGAAAASTPVYVLRAAGQPAERTTQH